MSSANYLFSVITTGRDLIQHQMRRMTQEIEMISEDMFESSTSQRLAVLMSAKYAFLIPRLQPEAAVRTVHDVEIDLSRGRDPLMSQLTGPRVEMGQQVVISVPFKGDGAFFALQPEYAEPPLPKGEVQGGMVIFTMQGVELEEAAVQDAYEAWLDAVSTNLDLHAQTVAPFNASVLDNIRTLIRHRWSVLKAKHEVLSQIRDGKTA